MLQRGLGLRLTGPFWWLGFLLLAGSCKPDTSTNSEERTTYLADYESPERPWGYVDSKGSLIIPATYDEVSPFSEGKAAVNRDGLWGYINTSGDQIIRTQFRSAYSFHENRARVKAFDIPEYYISPTGQVIASPDWVAVDDFSEGLARVKVGALFGYVDSLGQVMIKPVYSRAWNFHKGIAVVEFQDRQGAIDRTGQNILSPDYDRVANFGEVNLILAQREENTTVFNLSGQPIHQIHQARFLETDGVVLSLLKNGASWLYLLSEEKYIAKNGFDQLIYLGLHRWAAKYNGSYHLIDNEGKEIIPEPFDQLNKFNEGIAACRQDKYWGYIDANGRALTDMIFGLAWDYKNGFARAAFKDGIAFINTSQQIAFYPPAGTFELRDFSEGLAPVQIAQ